MARLRRRAYPTEESRTAARPDTKFGKREHTGPRNPRPTGQSGRGNLPNRPRKDR